MTGTPAALASTRTSPNHHGMQASAGHRIPGGEQRHIPATGDEPFGDVASHRFPGAVLPRRRSPGYRRQDSHSFVGLCHAVRRGVPSSNCSLPPKYCPPLVLRCQHFGFDCLASSSSFGALQATELPIGAATGWPNIWVLVRRAFIGSGDNTAFNPIGCDATWPGNDPEFEEKATDIIGLF